MNSQPGYYTQIRGLQRDGDGTDGMTPDLPTWDNIFLFKFSDFIFFIVANSNINNNASNTTTSRKYIPYIAPNCVFKCPFAQLADAKIMHICSVVVKSRGMADHELIYSQNSGCCSEGVVM